MILEIIIEQLVFWHFSKLPKRRRTGSFFRFFLQTKVKLSIFSDSLAHYSSAFLKKGSFIGWNRSYVIITPIKQFFYGLGIEIVNFCSKALLVQCQRPLPWRVGACKLLKPTSLVDQTKFFENYVILVIIPTNACQFVALLFGIKQV